MTGAGRRSLESPGLGWTWGGDAYEGRLSVETGTVWNCVRRLYL